MAVSLRLKFVTPDERRVQYSFSNVRDDVDSAGVRALMTAMSANKDIFADIPAYPLEADLIDRIVRPIPVL